jgi:hypothetical protein
MITSQIREFLSVRPFKPFGITLSDGREFNVNDSMGVAFAGGKDQVVVAVARRDYFMILNPEQIVSVGAPHPPESPSATAVKLSRQMLGLDPETGEEKKPGETRSLEGP